MILEQAYETLKKCELTESQYDFSRHWCGMGRSYMSWAKSADRDPSPKALLQLVYKIEDKIAELDSDQLDEFPEVTAHDRKALAAIHGQITAYLRRCLSFSSTQGATSNPLSFA